MSDKQVEKLSQVDKPNQVDKLILRDELLRVLLVFCQQNIAEHKPITVAYSGGVDSQVLLHALMSLKQQGLITNEIDALHVNHGLSKNALFWQQFCEQQAKSLCCDFTAKKVVLTDNSSESLEELARDARYNELEQHLSEHGVVFTAHHQDDQVETFLLALKRGSGVQGLSAMQSIRMLNATLNKLLARPLLDISRAKIEEYANTKNLEWIEDESNQHMRFDRNFIRAQVMPLLQSRWPAINQTIARSAEHCQKAQSIIAQIAEEDLTQCLVTAPFSHSIESLSLAQLNILTPERRNNVIRYFIKKNGAKLPSTKQLEQINRMSLSLSNDTMAFVQLGQLCLRRYKQALFITPNYKDISNWQFIVKKQDVLAPYVINLPDSLGTLTFQLVNVIDSDFTQTQSTYHDLTKLNSQVNTLQQTKWILFWPEELDVLQLDFKNLNPKCLPTFRNHRRELKKVLQELNVPTWQRKRLPFVKFDGNLAAVLPLFICKEYLGDSKQKCLKITWQS